MLRLNFPELFWNIQIHHYRFIRLPVSQVLHRTGIFVFFHWRLHFPLHTPHHHDFTSLHFQLRPTIIRIIFEARINNLVSAHEYYSNHCEAHTSGMPRTACRSKFSRLALGVSLIVLRDHHSRHLFCSSCI